MSNKVLLGGGLLCLSTLCVNPVLATQTAQPGELIRSEELAEKQKQLMAQIRSGRAYFIRDYDFFGIDLTPEQAVDMEKVLGPVRGNSLNQEDIDALCQQVREYINEKEKLPGEIACEVYKKILKIEYQK